ncbi:MAG: phosphoglucosamine mutase [Peptococcaceae bacterium]|nr:phosphoglucosamine mutase [Peptococcaceae bacterium]
MARLFGTDGVRGKVNTVLTGSLAYKIGLAYGKIYRDRGETGAVLIGRDTRISGDMLEKALAAGLMAQGVPVVSLGVIPTPGVAFLVRQRGAAAGAVISASHNPAYDNGIKFFSGEGYKIPDEIELAMEALILDGEDLEADLAEGTAVGEMTIDEEGVGCYADYLAAIFQDDYRGLSGVIDCANGAASVIAPGLFQRLGLSADIISAEPDGVNINDGCGSTHLDQLQQQVLAKKAQFGLAFDGDADRLLAVDELGEVVDGDEIIAICAKYLWEQNQLAENKLVVTMMSNLGLALAAKERGITLYQTNVGDRYVIEKMRAEGAILGGEQSGHIIFSRYNTTGDGLVTALNLLHILAVTGKSLSVLKREAMTKLPQVLKNIYVQDKKAWSENEKILAVVAEGEHLLGESGRIVIRPSGTEELIRIMAEGPDFAQLEQIVEAIGLTVKEQLG